MLNIKKKILVTGKSEKLFKLVYNVGWMLNIKIKLLKLIFKCQKYELSYWNEKILYVRMKFSKQKWNF